MFWIQLTTKELTSVVGCVDNSWAYSVLLEKRFLQALNILHSDHGIAYMPRIQLITASHMVFIEFLEPKHLNQTLDNQHMSSRTDSMTKKNTLEATLFCACFRF